MKSKHWYESKTVWAGLGLIVLGLGQMFTIGELDPQLITNILIGTGFIGGRQAMN